MLKENEIRAFTLIELLVVIAIIALLMSVLIPVINKARRLGMRVKCGSNVRQDVWALTMYAGDNNEHLPNITSGYWLWDLPFAVTDVLLKYTGKSREICYCPSNRWISAEKTGLWYFTLNVAEYAPEEKCQEMERKVSGADREKQYRVTGYSWLINREGAATQNWKPIISRVPLKFGEWPKTLSQKRENRSLSEVELICDTIISSSAYGTNPRKPREAVMKTPGGTQMKWGWPSPSNHLLRNDKVEGGNIGFCDGSVYWRKFDKMMYRNQYGEPVNWW
jgi:prepilin-type N-terminal cleavage/methylation domain-containing protein/prepilin-type processing-associated H-X9-DG protein